MLVQQLVKMRNLLDVPCVCFFRVTLQLISHKYSAAKYFFLAFLLCGKIQDGAQCDATQALAAENRRELILDAEKLRTQRSFCCRRRSSERSHLWDSGCGSAVLPHEWWIVRIHTHTPLSQKTKRPETLVRRWVGGGEAKTNVT